MGARGKGGGGGAREKEMNRVKTEDMRNSRKNQMEETGAERGSLWLMKRRKCGDGSRVGVRKMWVMNRKLKCGMKNERKGIQATVI